MAMGLTAPRRGCWARTLRVLVWGLGLLTVGAAGGGFWFYRQMTASLPQLDGEVRLPGLSAPMTVERDEFGVPTIRASNRLDAARALGFLHAQERFFQMDLLRRRAAGELAELFGPSLIPVDRSNRVHRFRKRARRVIEVARPEERALVAAYSAGVNAGLGMLKAPPFEYMVIRARPAPWGEEDSILVAFAMFLELHDENGQQELELGRLRRQVSPAMFEFLAPQGTEWDAPLFGEPLPTPQVPRADELDLRDEAKGRSGSVPATEPGGVNTPGSNNWAVAGAHTADGRALLANDMHLGLSVPNIWYRAVQIFPDERSEIFRLVGLTLPGSPFLVAGSTGHVAWGFTNSFGDWTDVIELELDPEHPERYRTPDGWREMERSTETIQVSGGDSVLLEVRETMWGPVLDGNGPDRPYALAWTAHHPEAVNSGLMRMETVHTVDEAIEQAHASGLPPQNFVVADAQGRIGWTIVGAIPRRMGFSGRLPSSWADGSHRWDGWLTSEEVPALVDPPQGRLWTANNRTTTGEMLSRLGDGGYDLGARARQIRDGLLALEKARPEDMLKLQLDDRALFLSRWRDLLLATLDDDAVAEDERRGELRRLLESSWSGRAAVDSVAYRATRVWRLRLAQRLWFELTGQTETPEEQRFGFSPQFEGPLWRLVSERPAHLLPAKELSWKGLMLSVVDQTLASFATRGPILAERTWGERNQIAPQHPLSLAVPLLGKLLDVPAQALPGDDYMPRVLSPDFGASQRFVVSPGNEEKGLFHMPVGQSGHPLSSYYRNGHQAWADGQPTPLLPGSTRSELRLVPR